MTVPLTPVSLGTYPTPLLPAPRLARQLGLASLHIKRDDLTGFSLGGNKVRKLEYLLADACARGASKVIVCGGPGSNLCQATAAAAPVVGLDCELILYGSRPDSPPLNLRLAELSGAVVHFTGDRDRASVDTFADARANEVTAAGGSPYIIPRGGATPVGALGYHQAAIELADQLLAVPIEPGAVVVAVGSGGTLAGILSGMAAVGATWPVIGASVSRGLAEIAQRVESLAALCSEHSGTAPPSAVPRLVDARGPGYGREWSDAAAVADLARRTEALLFDPIYTAKAFATLVAMMGEMDGPVVFWHTGGIATALESVVREEPA